MRSFVDIAHDLANAPDLKAIERNANEFVRSQGFKYFAYVQKARDGSRLSISNYPAEMRHRIAELPDNDPVVRHVKSGLPPGAWDEQGTVSPKTLRYGKHAVRLMQEAGEKGMRAGITAPVNGMDLHYGIFTVSLGDRFQARDVVGKVPFVYCFGTYLHSRLVELQTPNVPGGLTEREIDCLALAKDGLTSERIGEILKIARNSVDKHLGSAARRLGAPNRQGAIMAALSRGLI